MGRTPRALSVKSKNSAKWHKGAIQPPDGIDEALPSSAGCGERGAPPLEQHEDGSSRPREHRAGRHPLAAAGFRSRDSTLILLTALRNAAL